MAFRILLSARLGELRWTQADLARATGIRSATINEMYWNLTDRITLGQVNTVCNVLGCRPEDILVWEPDGDGKGNTQAGKEKPTRPKRK